MGGGFGGKETRNIFISAALAVAAQKVFFLLIFQKKSKSKTKP